MKKNQLHDWDLVITPKRGLFVNSLTDIWKFRDLLMMFVKRDIVTVYKQTILGPLWFFIQPALTTVVYLVVFDRIAKISTDGIPPILFYLSGVVFWNYFAQCFMMTSNSFRANEAIFGKVYFPRLIIPISVVVSNLFKFGVQLILFGVIYSYYLFRNIGIETQWELLWLIPFLVMMMAILGLSFGMIFSSLTTKYRDLTFLLAFGVQLLMYATPIIYPMSILEESYRQAIWFNPMAHIIEGFKYILLGSGVLSVTGLLYTTVLTFMSFFFGLTVFARTEQNFIDTV